MNKILSIPPNLPKIARLPCDIGHAGLADVVSATLLAGLWAAEEIEAGLKAGRAISHRKIRDGMGADQRIPRC